MALKGSIARSLHLVLWVVVGCSGAHGAAAGSSGTSGAPEGVETSLVVLPDVTHALNRVAQPDFTKITPADIGASVDGAVLAMVSKAARAIVGE